MQLNGRRYEVGTEYLMILSIRKTFSSPIFRMTKLYVIEKFARNANCHKNSMKMDGKRDGMNEWLIDRWRVDNLIWAVRQLILTSFTLREWISQRPPFGVARFAPDPPPPRRQPIRTLVLIELADGRIDAERQVEYYYALCAVCRVLYIVWQRYLWMHSARFTELLCYKIIINKYIIAIKEEKNAHTIVCLNSIWQETAACIDDFDQQSTSFYRWKWWIGLWVCVRVYVNGCAKCAHNSVGA